jgi:membrane protein
VPTERADSPTDLPRRSLGSTLKRTWSEFREDALPDWAAALTYYGVLAMFPALLVLVSLVGLLGEDATQALLDNVAALAPGPAREIVTGAIENLQSNRGAAGIAFVVGLAGALWSASGYVGAFMRASNSVWDVEEGRPVWKTLPLRVGVTLAAMLVLSLGLLAVVISGPLAERVGDVIGAGDTAVAVWNLAKWPAIVLLLSLLLALLYYAAPNVRHPGIRWISPGSVLAVLLWLAASGLFALFVSNFGSYNATYGALAGVIIFLVWLWISNIAILLGAELNSELEREREIRAGAPAEREPFLPPRDAPAAR